MRKPLGGCPPPPDIVGMKTRKKEKEKSEKAMEWKEKGKNGEKKGRKVRRGKNFKVASKVEKLCSFNT